MSPSDTMQDEIGVTSRWPRGRAFSGELEVSCRGLWQRDDTKRSTTGRCRTRANPAFQYTSVLSHAAASVSRSPPPMNWFPRVDT